MLPELGVAIDHAGGWMLERRTLAPDAMELILEISLDCLRELYAALLAHGVELSGDSHRTIAQCIACSLHLRLPTDVSSIVSISIFLRFFDPPPQPTDLVQRFPQTTPRA